MHKMDLESQSLQRRQSLKKDNNKLAALFTVPRCGEILEKLFRISARITITLREMDKWLEKSISPMGQEVGFKFLLHRIKLQYPQI
jgi:hypothetical protein